MGARTCATMKKDRNPHKAFYLLDFSPGSLLHHLPLHFHNLPLAQSIQLASDRHDC